MAERGAAATQGRLAGKTALITGAARGLGAQIARRFAEAGARVLINDLNLGAAQAMADEVGGLAFACDVSDSGSVDTMFRELAGQVEALDILVNNAGISGAEGDNRTRQRIRQAADAMARGERATMGASIVDVDDASWSRMLAVHLNGTFFCSRAAARRMLPRQQGNIINMGSIYGTDSPAGALAYAAAKAGILGFTRSLAKELAPDGIRVNAIAPGWIHTAMTDPLEPMHPFLAAQTPLGRLGEPDDIAWAAVYLASDEAKFVTGQTLSPNGGWYTSQ